MKIRIGFVSNSSTSSFLIYGTTLEKDELQQLLIKSLPPESIVYLGSNKDVDEIDVYETLYGILNTYGLESYRPYYDSTFYIGASWSSVGLDETGRQFQERVQNGVKALLKKDDLEFDTYEEAWHD
jgi:hypothetical protein